MEPACQGTRKTRVLRAQLRHRQTHTDSRQYKPGDTISLDYAFGEQAPSAEVLKALEDFDKALRREDSVFRQLRKSVLDAVAAKRKFK